MVQLEYPEKNIDGALLEKYMQAKKLEALAHVAGGPAPPWPLHVFPARYHLYSFQDIPAGPSIFQSIFQHILEYMDTDSPLEGLRSSKICQNRAKSRIIAHNRSENASLQQGGPKLFDFDSI